MKGFNKMAYAIRNEKVVNIAPPTNLTSNEKKQLKVSTASTANAIERAKSRKYIIEKR